MAQIDNLKTTSPQGVKQHNLLLGGKFPYIIPIWMDRPKVSAYHPKSDGSEECFSILWRSPISVLSTR